MTINSSVGSNEIGCQFTNIQKMMTRKTAISLKKREEKEKKWEQERR
jgi:hypothetical protein